MDLSKIFGDESRLSAFIGAHLGVLTLPNAAGLDGELLGVGRTAGMYGARHLGDARALFLFRSERELDHHHRDVIPTSRLGVTGLAQGARLISALPAGPGRALLRLTTKSARLCNSMTVDDYPPSPLAPVSGSSV
ncbi:hypothetical protein [Nonomuraea sp. NPDC050643]|uniref:hypothetical protein n=1 Tax=Nonomuraea sp. NPDC050643 TaxID=3155660 RepID=UPI0033D5D644